MNYLRSTTKLAMCVAFAGFLTAMTPMAVSAEEVRLEAEDSQQETAIASESPVIIVGEKMKAIREAKAAKKAEEAKLAEEAEATKEVEEVVQTTSPVITVGEARRKKAEEAAEAALSNEIWSAEENGEVDSSTSQEDEEETKTEAVVATASNAVAMEPVADLATSSNATPATEEKQNAEGGMAARAALSVEQVAKPTNLVSLGVFRTTGYCSCRKCCGKWGKQTVTGAVPQVNHTVAVDPRKIPYGTKLLINGVEYVAEDCGSKVKGNHIDIYYPDHRTAQMHGLRKAEVFVVR